MKLLSSKKTKTKASAKTAQGTSVLISPVVTEKAAHAAGSHVYTFFVSLKATRTAVAKAVETQYGVKPVAVRIIRGRREPVRFGRFHGTEKAQKKALVQLPKGKTLDVYEGV